MGDLFDTDGQRIRKNSNPEHRPNIEGRGPTVRPYGVPPRSVNNVAITPAAYSAAPPLNENEDENIYANSVYDHHLSSGIRRRNKQSRPPKLNEISCCS